MERERALLQLRGPGFGDCAAAVSLSGGMDSHILWQVTM